MPKITYTTTREDSMIKKLSEIKDYLINEQDYTEEEVDEIPVEELLDLYEMYNED